MGQPSVCGEIAAGLALGPSLLGGLFPGVHAVVFPAEAAAGLKVLSEIGLALLLFMVGLNLELAEIRLRKGAALTISLAGVFVPFTLGLALAELLHTVLAPAVDPLAFRLFVATAISITAIPALARILDDCNLHRTRIGALVTTAAAVDDVVGWTLLAVVSAAAESRFSGIAAVGRLAGVAVFACVAIGVVRPWLTRVCARVSDEATFDRPGILSAALVGMCGGAALTAAMGLSAVFGAFIVGVTLSCDSRLRDALRGRLQLVVISLFLPLFFTYTGLRTDLGSIHGWIPVLLCVVVVAVAIAGKVGGCALAATSQGLPAREAWSIGLLMNTRGLMELVVANIGLDLGIIDRTVFCMLVVMTVTTTYMTTPLVMRVLRHTDFQPFLDQAPLARPTGASQAA
jgi:Kef-type K+ transport system membrane component KefB